MQLGGKGANLAEMSSIGLSVPPGFTVSTEACQQYQEAGRSLPQGLWDEILDGLAWVEEYMGARLGDPQRPLLLSVRSGAAVSTRHPPSVVVSVSPPPAFVLILCMHACRCRCLG
jgi:pyruvate,orthophosphate dikinase